MYHLDVSNTIRSVQNTYCLSENLQTAPGGRWISGDCLFFTEADAEALRGAVTCPGSHSQNVVD